MREINYIIERTSSFFQQSEQFRFCCGSKRECAELVEDENFTVIEWNADASALEIEKIKLLFVEATKAQLKKAELPPFVENLEKLENIAFDLSFLRKVKQSSLPDSLRSLTLTRNPDYEDILDELVDDPVEWNDRIILTNLEAIKLIADDEKTGVIETVSKDVFPSLKFLAFDVSEEAELEVFGKFSALTDVELLYIKDYDVFSKLEHLPLISLDLGGTNNKFDLSGIEKLRNLKFVRLNSVRSEIDCRIFKSLPELKELVILNSKKIVNIEALLECPNLVSIEFLDCNDPFKRGIAEKFMSKKYELLDIEYA